MLNLSNVLQLVIHCLYYSLLPEKHFVGYGHQCSLHVTLQFLYKLYAIHKADTCTITRENLLDEHLPFGYSVLTLSFGNFQITIYKSYACHIHTNRSK